MENNTTEIISPYCSFKGWATTWEILVGDMLIDMTIGKFPRYVKKQVN